MYGCSYLYGGLGMFVLSLCLHGMFMRQVKSCAFVSVRTCRIQGVLAVRKNQKQRGSLHAWVCHAVSEVWYMRLWSEVEAYPLFANFVISLAVYGKSR